jgi:hypothetical protein
MLPLVSCLTMCCPSVDSLHWAMMRDGGTLGTVRISLSSIIVGWLRESPKLGEARRGEMVVVDLGDRSAGDSSVADLCIEPSN